MTNAGGIDMGMRHREMDHRREVYSTNVVGEFFVVGLDHRASAADDDRAHSSATIIT